MKLKFVLTTAAEADRADFIAEYYGYSGNCSCHISPPCGSCTHTGNPANQAEDEECWEREAQEPDVMEAVRAIARGAL